MSDLFLFDSFSGCTRFLSKESLSENKSNIFVFEVFLSFMTMDGKSKNRSVELIRDSCVKSSSKSDFSGVRSIMGSDPRDNDSSGVFTHAYSAIHANGFLARASTRPSSSTFIYKQHHVVSARILNLQL